MTLATELDRLRPMRFLWLGVGLCVAACTVGDSAREQLLLSNNCRHELVPWGAGSEAVGLSPAGDERIARSVPAAAAGPAGELYLIDAVNRRIQVVDAHGQVATFVTDIPVAASDIAVGDDGALAIYSRALATVVLFASDGSPAGELRLPRELRNLVAISLGPSRQVILHNANQDSYLAGSPAAPLALAEILHSHSEGALRIDDDHAIVALATGGHGELVVKRSSDRSEARAQVSARFPIPGLVSAVQLVGVGADIACARVEAVASGNPIAVDRRAVCLDLRDGRWLVDVAMAPPGLYRPAHDLSFTGTPPRLVELVPEPAGLGLDICAVRR